MHESWLSFAEVFLRLMAAVTVGATIGLNRSLHHKPAGFGTNALVSLGAGLATMFALRAPGGDAATVSRVVQGLVTGVGFIGAGVIMRSDKETDVHGLTTAASIWASAILGIGCGLADFMVAAIGAIMALMILVLNKRIEDVVARMMNRGPKHPSAGEPGGRS